MMAHSDRNRGRSQKLQQSKLMWSFRSRLSRSVVFLRISGVNLEVYVYIDDCIELSPYEALQKFPEAIFLISSSYSEEIIEFINNKIPSTIRWFEFDKKELMIESNLIHYYIYKPTTSTIGFNNSWFKIYADLENNVGGKNYFDFVYSILEDSKSKNILKNRISGIMTGQLSKFLDISIDKKEYYSDDYFEIKNNEVYFDCGAFNGDTLIDFIKFTKEKYKKILTFEPDVKNFSKLVRLIKDRNYSNVEAICAATGFYNGKIGFSTTGTMGAKVDECEKNNVVPIVKLDNYLDENPTFIKMDVEGAELDSIKGAETIITRLKPKLAICIYHRPMDFYLIPMTLKKMVPEYKFKIRQHQVGFSDLVLYAYV